MEFIYIQSILSHKKTPVPFRICVKKENESEKVFTFRPETTLSKNVCQTNNLDRIDLLSANPFCDFADDLIELFQDNQLVFSDVSQMKILKAQFKNIGYNFNVKPKYVWFKKDENQQKLNNLMLNVIELHDFTEDHKNVKLKENFFGSNTNYEHYLDETPDAMLEKLSKLIPEVTL
jgi:hypothetical protein